MTPERLAMMKIADSRESGWLTAWDPVKQKEVWHVAHERAGNGGVLTTAGNLVFEGSAARTFAAYKADTANCHGPQAIGGGVIKVQRHRAEGAARGARHGELQQCAE